MFFITYTWVTTNFLVRLTYIDVLSDAYMHVMNSLFCKTYKIALNSLDVVAHKTLLKTSQSNMIFTWSIGWSLCVYTHIMIDSWMETHFYYYGILTHIKTIWFVIFLLFKTQPTLNLEGREATLKLLNLRLGFTSIEEMLTKPLTKWQFRTS